MPNIYITEELHQELKLQSVKKKLTMRELTTQILKEGLK